MNLSLEIHFFLLKELKMKAQFLSASYRDPFSVIALFLAENNIQFSVIWSRRDDHLALSHYCLLEEAHSSDPAFAERVLDAILVGESDDNPDLELYLTIRDSFDAEDCKALPHNITIVRVSHAKNERFYNPQRRTYDYHEVMVNIDGEDMILAMKLPETDPLLHLVINGPVDLPVDIMSLVAEEAERAYSPKQLFAQLFGMTGAFFHDLDAENGQKYIVAVDNNDDSYLFFALRGFDNKNKPIYEVLNEKEKNDKSLIKQLENELNSMS